MKTKEVLNLLIKNQYTITFAESMTGGQLIASLTKNPGSSKVLNQSYVLYSKEAKNQVLNIHIKDEPIVSEKVALMMVKGLKEKHTDDVLVSITGNAGPTTQEKGVLEAYIAMTIKDKTYTYHLSFNQNNRSLNIEETTDFIYEKLYQLLKEN